MRLQVVFSTTLPTASTQSAVYRDTNYSGRLGWKEIVVQQAGGARLLRSTAPSSSVSDALRRYPQDMLSSPLDETEARFTFTPSLQPASSARSSFPRSTMVGPNSSLHLGPLSDRFAALIAPSHAPSSLLVFSLLAAVALGALHALSPGHGKAVMAAYLVGARGTARHAVQLGITITTTHTAGVFALGLVTLYAASIVTPERLYPWVTFLSGALIVAIGGLLLVSRARTAWHGHEHHDGGSDDHRHQPIGRRGLLALGVSSGIIPCPSALVVLLAAVSLHRVVFGILLIVAFSAGLAAALTGIGLALAGGLPLLLRSPRLKGRRIIAHSARLVPLASALVVTIAGLGLTLQAIPGMR
jgi:nickel/cobalt transporter (NicO) family protein